MHRKVHTAIVINYVQPCSLLQFQEQLEAYALQNCTAIPQSHCSRHLKTMTSPRPTNFLIQATAQMVLHQMKQRCHFVIFARRCLQLWSYRWCSLLYNLKSIVKIEVIVDSINDILINGISIGSCLEYLQNLYSLVSIWYLAIEEFDLRKASLFDVFVYFL